MALLDQITQLVKDPPPLYVFELSDAGIAFARGMEAGFAPFEPGTLAVSPVQDNVLHPEKITAVLSRIAPQNGNKTGSKKRRRAALILPDYAARVSVLDFDSFPASPQEQLPLIRFRLKKTLPFDIDSAAVSYYVQSAAPNGHREDGRIEVVTVTIALEIIARYEALFRSTNFHAGEITTSALAALNLYRDADTAVIAKLAGRVLTVMVVREGVLKLLRCVELEEATEAEVLSILQPTFAYVEDELAAPASRLILCGFASGALSGRDLSGTSRPREVLQSRLGAPTAFNAGLLGYLEGAQN